MNLAVTLGLTSICLAGLGYGVYHVVPPAPEPIEVVALPVPVVTATVQQHDVPIVLQGLGTVQALNTATIRSQVTGLLQSVNFTEGQVVHRGDLLAQLDPRPNQARLDQAIAQLARDQVHLTDAQVKLDRDLPLLSKGLATDQQVTHQKSRMAQLHSAIQSDQAAIEDARTQLSYTALTAPFDGVTGVRLLDVGNIIHAADTTGVVVVTQVQPIAVLFTLPSADIPQVMDCMAKGPVQADAYDEVGVRALDTGQLLLINNQADPATGTVQLKALFPNPQRLLWPGVFVNVELTTSIAKAALTIPTDAVQQGAQGEFVFVLGADNKVATHRVHVSQRSRGVALVSAGLKAGETVVARGQYRLLGGSIGVSARANVVADASTATSKILP
jgi:membrane fusion protein, multidrug efflux system